MKSFYEYSFNWYWQKRFTVSLLKSIVRMLFLGESHIGTS